MPVRRSRSGGIVALAVPAIVVFAILVSLGNWQLRRLAWKQALIESVETRPGMPPIAIPSVAEWDAFDVEASLYRRLKLEGRFDHDAEAWVFTHLPDPQGRFGGPGFWIVTPMILSDGGTVWVNRGFAPDGRHRVADRNGNPPAGPAGIVEVMGLIRPDESRSFATPDDTPEKNIFYARNIAALSAAKGLRPPVAPFTVDLLAKWTPPSGLPQAGETRSRYPNSHLQYALTWYGLAAALVVVFCLFAWRQWHHSA